MEKSYADLMSRRGRSHHRPPGRFPAWAWVLLVVLLIVIGGAVYVASALGLAVGEIYQKPTEEVAPEVLAAPVKEGERINILLMGLDDAALRSDTMLLLSIDADQKRVGAIQIPRDTRALLAGKGSIEKINGAYAYGVGDKRFPAHLRALKTVEDLLDVPVHYTVVVELEAFRQAVDALGGVTVEVPFAMNYDDPVQNLSIHLQPGRQNLSGKQALEFVRWRQNNDGTGYPDGDLGRIRTQQQFLKALTDQMMQPANLSGLPSIIKKVAKYVETTIEPARLASLALLVPSLARENIEVATLPGVAASLPDPTTGQFISYYVHDPTATQRLVDRLVYGVDPGAAAKVPLELSAPLGDHRARQVMARLSQQGFPVTQVPAPVQVPQRVRIETGGHGKAEVLLVARALMAQGLPVETAEVGTGQAIRVILGGGQ